MNAPDDETIIEHTRRWLEKAVIGLNLCPFAKAPYAKGLVRISVSHARHLDGFLEDLDREAFIVISLDTKNQPLSINVAHIGNINSSIVSPACVMRVALLSNAASIMVAHNHPSGNPLTIV